MGDPVTVGIGMMVAGAVVEKQEWFGDKFGEALMLGGAVVAMNPGGVFDPSVVTTKAGEMGMASALEPVSADIPLNLAGTGGETALTLSEPGLGAATDSAITSVSEMVPSLDPSVSGLLSSATTVNPAVEPSFMDKFVDSKYAAPALTVAGPAVAGMAQAKSEEEIEKERIAEEERLRKLKSSWGRTAGGHQVNLDMGTGLTAMSDRFYANRNDPQSQGGLLS